MAWPTHGCGDWFRHKAEVSSLLQQAGMTSHALPLPIGKDPGVGEASQVVIGLAHVTALRAIGASHYSGALKEVYLHVLDRQVRGLELWVGDIGEKLPPVTDLAIPFSVHKLVGDHAAEGLAIAMHLSFIPEALERNQLAFLGARAVGHTLGNCA